MSTPRCRLRPVGPDDVATFFDHQADPAASALAAVPTRTSEAHEQHWARITTDPAVILRAILATDCTDATGRADGEGVLDGADRLVGYLVVFDRNGERELGYWLGRAHWGRGLATAALGMFLAEIDERPLSAHVAEHNPASAAVLLRNGFREVGGHVEANGLRMRDFVLPQPPP